MKYFWLVDMNMQVNEGDVIASQFLYVHLLYKCQFISFNKDIFLCSNM